MTDILLIYPFFLPKRDRSVFRFPPLGIAYMASSLRAAGHAIRIVDCTFLDRGEALAQSLATPAEVVGIYCMVSMIDDAKWFAQHLRQPGRLLVAGGPLPSCDPALFAGDFDIAVIGEAESTMPEIVNAFEAKAGYENISGIAFRLPQSTAERPEVVKTLPRRHGSDLDAIRFPGRELLPNEKYIAYGKKKYGYSITTVMSSRGCPYHCEFCSNILFGGSYRERSAANIVDEIEEALKLGYDRISFGDDVFTMRREHVAGICSEILNRQLSFSWECLGRVDTIDAGIALLMVKAGCRRIYFGIESGNSRMLTLMNKEISIEQARSAVEACNSAGLEVGAFFILCYPGDTNDSVLETISFATSLPLTYLGLSMPYPLPGTALFERVKERIRRDWRPDQSMLWSHVLLFNADFSEVKMWFAIIKGHLQHRLRKSLGSHSHPLFQIFEKLTNMIFRILR